MTLISPTRPAPPPKGKWAFLKINWVTLHHTRTSRGGRGRNLILWGLAGCSIMCRRTQVTAWRGLGSYFNNKKKVDTKRSKEIFSTFLDRILMSTSRWYLPPPPITLLQALIIHWIYQTFMECQSSEESGAIERVTPPPPLPPHPFRERSRRGPAVA